MSYILDALKKAAEQRDVHAPAIRRFLSSAPEIENSAPWRIALVGGGAACAGAAVVALLWVLWPATPIIVTEHLDVPPATARVQTETPPVVEPPAPSAPPLVRTTPAPAPTKAAPETRSPTVKPRIVEARRPPADGRPAAPEPPAVSPPIVSRPESPAVAAPAPAVKPAPTVGAAASSPMKLEVIVYSDERARRLAFINGRKYVEGDTLLDGAKIQEIQPNAVVIVEDGRRVTLRP